MLTTTIGNCQTAYNDASGCINPNFLNLFSGKSSLTVNVLRVSMHLMTPGEIGNRVLTPGLYKWTTGVSTSNDVVISGSASDSAIFIFPSHNPITNADPAFFSLDFPNCRHLQHVRRQAHHPVLPTHTDAPPTPSAHPLRATATDLSMPPPPPSLCHRHRLYATAAAVSMPPPPPSPYHPRRRLPATAATLFVSPPLPMPCALPSAHQLSAPP